jgi:hypothetical protein
VVFFWNNLKLNQVFEPYCTPGICRSTKKEEMNRIYFVHSSPKKGEKMNETVRETIRRKING